MMAPRVGLAAFALLAMVVLANAVDVKIGGTERAAQLLPAKAGIGHACTHVKHGLHCQIAPAKLGGASTKQR